MTHEIAAAMKDPDQVAAAIHWRETWKYGERAFRYCQHDVRHAIGALRFAAAALGWSAALLHGLSDQTIEDLPGLNRGEAQRRGSLLH